MPLSCTPRTQHAGAEFASSQPLERNAVIPNVRSHMPCVITLIAAQPAERDRTRVRGLARQAEAGFGFAIDGNGRRDPAAPRFNNL
jgi:hypothetical protein